MREGFHVLPREVLRKTLESHATILRSRRKDAPPLRDILSKMVMHLSRYIWGGRAVKQLITELNVFIDRP